MIRIAPGIGVLISLFRLPQLVKGSAVCLTILCILILRHIFR